MIQEGAFLFAIAAVSGSLYGLAGLVAALRRGEGLRPVDTFRLRQIVEFAFANVLLALSAVPIAALTEDVALTVRVLAVAGAGYLATDITVLFRRLRRAGLAMTPGWRAVAAGLDFVAFAVAALAFVVATMPAFELLLIVLLARPMAAFLFVLTTFESAPGPDSR